MGIENKLHWRRDVSMNEDRCRVRAGAGALAAMRNLVLAMLRSTGASVPVARETYAAGPSAALHAVTPDSLYGPGMRSWACRRWKRSKSFRRPARRAKP